MLLELLDFQKIWKAKSQLVHDMVLIALFCKVLHCDGLPGHCPLRKVVAWAQMGLHIKKSGGKGRSGPSILRWRAGKSGHGRTR